MIIITKHACPRAATLPWGSGLVMLLSLLTGMAQVDPKHRHLVQLGYDQPLSNHGPRGAYAYYYYNNPEIAGTNVALRLAIAPVYLDGELGFKEVLTPSTDVGVGFYGGAYGDNYYEVRQGDYLRDESFDGHGGGMSLSLYHLLNPEMLIPLNTVLRGGLRYSTYHHTSRTRDDFELPDDRAMAFVRAGFRLAGKEPRLYPDLAMEASVWVERQWRLNDGEYGFNRDRRVESRADLYWAFAGLDYAWTNVGHKISLAVTAGGSEDGDRFSAWRLGGVLPLVAEFPLVLPGYYYQEISARRFAHFYAGYTISLDPKNRFQFQMEAATARVDYLTGFEQPDPWLTVVGCGLMLTSKNTIYRVAIRYGYGFDAMREDGQTGSHSIGLLAQYDFEQLMFRRRNKVPPTGQE